MKRTILTFAIILTSLSVTTHLQASEESHRKAAGALLNLMNPKELFVSSFSAAFEPTLAQLKNSGQSEENVEKVRAASIEFAKTIANDPEMEKRMEDLYIESFTEKELTELLAFYQTSTGKKSLQKMPELFQKGSMIGQELAMKHQQGFQKKIEAILGGGE